MQVPVLPPLTIPLPDPALPGVTGELLAYDVRALSDEDRQQVAARIYEDWTDQLGDPTEQPGSDEDAIGIGVYLNGDLVAWGALHTVTVTEPEPGKLTVTGTMLAESGIDGLGALIAAVANASPLEAGEYTVTLVVSGG